MINIAIQCLRDKENWIVIEQDEDSLYFVDEGLTLTYSKKQILDVIEGRAELVNFWMCNGELHINLYYGTFFVAQKYVTLLLDYMLQETP